MHGRWSGERSVKEEIILKGVEAHGGLGMRDEYKTCFGLSRSIRSMADDILPSRPIDPFIYPISSYPDPFPLERYHLVQTPQEHRTPRQCPVRYKGKRGLEVQHHPC